MVAAETSSENAVSAAAPPTASYDGVDGYSPALVARFRAAAEARSAAAAAATAAATAAAGDGGSGAKTAVQTPQSEVTTSSVNSAQLRAAGKTDRSTSEGV